MLKQVGSFENRSGEFIVSDPSYERGVFCQGKITNVKKGKWLAFTETQEDGRVAELQVEHDSCCDPFSEWNKCDFEVGVDSGMAGIFDSIVYKNNLNEDFLVKSGEMAVVIPGGTLSSSGYGDGSYTAYCARSFDKEVIAVKIVFIDEQAQKRFEKIKSQTF